MESLCQSAVDVVDKIKQSEIVLKDSKQISEKNISIQMENQNIQGEIKKLAAAISGSTSTANKVTFSEIVKTPHRVVPSIKKQVPLIVRPKVKQSREQTREDLNKNIDPTNFNFSSVQFRHNGDIFISAECEDDRDKIRLEMEKQIGTNYEIKAPDVLLPRLLLSGLSEKLDDVNLSAAIQKQNPMFSLKTIKVVRQYQVKRGNRTYFNAIVEVDTEAFPKIISWGKLNVGWERCRVFDGTSVLRCFKCKGFNHRSDNCTEKEVCARCHGEHRTDSCSLPLLNKCINCIYSNKKFNLSLNVDHCILDKSCPEFQRNLAGKKKKIGY